MGVRVDRCVCLGRTLADLCEQARREGLDADGVMALAGCRAGQGGSRCGLCRPYVREALRTGETVFLRLLTE